MMKTHDFKLILTGVPSTDEADALYGIIDDGTFSIINGVAEIAFDRDAASLEVAIATSIADAKEAGFQVERIELQPEGFAVAAA